MTSNEMLENAVKALKKKYTKNGFLAVSDEEDLERQLKVGVRCRDNMRKDYFAVIPCSALVDKDIENVFYLADCNSKMVGYIFDRRNGIDSLHEINAGQATDLLWKQEKKKKPVVVVTERPTVSKFKENSWDKIVALKREGEAQRNQIYEVGKKQIESILKKAEK